MKDIDYYLVKHWHQFQQSELGLMVERFFECYHRSAEELPEEVNLFLKHLREKSILTSYGTDQGLEKAVRRIEKRGQRIIPHHNPLTVIAPLASETEELCCRLYSEVRVGGSISKSKLGLILPALVPENPSFLNSTDRDQELNVLW